MESKESVEADSLCIDILPLSAILLYSVFNPVLYHNHQQKGFAMTLREVIAKGKAQSNGQQDEYFWIKRKANSKSLRIPHADKDYPGCFLSFSVEDLLADDWEIAC